MHRDPSAIEHRPANVVSQALIVQNQFADRVWQLFTLPSALDPPEVLGFAFRSGCTRRLDRVSRRSKLVRGDVRHRRGLSGGICRMSGGTAQVSRSRVGHARSLARLRHPDLATHPGPSLRNGLARPWVERSRRLKQVQDVFGTRRGPQGE